MSSVNRYLVSSIERLEHLGPGAVQKWGERAQTVKAVEELAELQVQLCKLLNGSPTTPEAVVDEVADVIIVACQIRLHGTYRQAVDERIAMKLDHLEAAIKRDFERPEHKESMR